jgi:Fe-S cluster biogenesis protein NfuA
MTLAATIAETLADRVNTALESIRPYLQTDGGNVRVLEVTEDGVARLELQGACGTCPMSMMTLRTGVEDTILRAVPEITRVEAINAEGVLVG